MPNCRYCGARISKFDADICPVCGTKDPLKDVNSETIEITSQIDINGFKEGQKVVRRKKKLLIYFILLGIFGVPLFYIKKRPLGAVWAISNILLFVASFMLLNFSAHLLTPLAVAIPLLALIIVNTVVGVIMFYTPNLKDGEGEFIV